VALKMCLSTKRLITAFMRTLVLFRMIPEVVIQFVRSIKDLVTLITCPGSLGL
jgi:hypothetical protein